jgi:nucleotide-binding universal stress UspA family protein
VSADIHVPFRDVVFAMDFSPASIRGAEAIVPLLTTGSVVHLVHVWERSAVHDTRLRTLDESYAASLTETFRRRLEILALPSGIAVKEAVLEGRSSERLLDYADAHSADVVVAGRQGHIRDRARRRHPRPIRAALLTFSLVRGRG